MASLLWTPEHIQQALRLRGWTQRRLAEFLGVSASAVSYGIRTGSSFDLREKVSEILGEPEQSLWPSRFPPQWRDSDPPQ